MYDIYDLFCPWQDTLRCLYHVKTRISFFSSWVEACFLCTNGKGKDSFQLTTIKFIFISNGSQNYQYIIEINVHSVVKFVCLHISVKHTTCYIKRQTGLNGHLMSDISLYRYYIFYVLVSCRDPFKRSCVTNFYLYQ